MTYNPYHLIKTLLRSLRSARLQLWVPIFGNTAIVAFLLSHSIKTALILGLSLCFTAAYGFLINDLWDLQVDRDNQAGRLETAPKGVLVCAQLLSGAFFFSGLATSAVLGTKALAWMFLIAVGLTAYTFRIRREFLTANMLAATLSAAPLWLPNVVLDARPGGPQMIVILAAFIMLLGREFIFDIVGIVGDSNAGRSTLPIRFGKKLTCQIAATLELIGCCSLALFAVLFAFRGPFVMAGLLLAVLVLFAALVIPASLRLVSALADHNAARRFVFQTRLAMVLLPLVLLLLMTKY